MYIQVQNLTFQHSKDRQQQRSIQSGDKGVSLLVKPK